MPAAVAVPLIVGAASAGAQLYGAKKGSDAAKAAARDQGLASEKAFGYAREERDRMSSLNRPFMEGSGERAMSRRNAMNAGLPGEGMGLAPQWSGGRPPQGPSPQRPPQGPPPPMSGGMGENMGGMRDRPQMNSVVMTEEFAPYYGPPPPQQNRLQGPGPRHGRPPYGPPQQGGAPPIQQEMMRATPISRPIQREPFMPSPQDEPRSMPYTPPAPPQGYLPPEYQQYLQGRMGSMRQR